MAFDDGVGEVSGSWVTDRAPSSEPGLLLYTMVDSVASTSDAVAANGGRIVRPSGFHPHEIIALFADPDANILGLYQEPSSPR